MIATQMNRVLWMNAAVGAVAIDSPVKNRTNGMLPPMTAIASSPTRRRPSRTRASRARTQGQRESDEDDGRHAVLGRRVDRRVGHELDTERVEVDGEAADGGGARARAGRLARACQGFVARSLR